MNIRAPAPTDVTAIKRIVQDTDLFPPDLLDKMIEPFLCGNDAQDQWLVCETERDGVIGFSYCRREQLTEGTWNLLALGFRTEHQGSGLGSKLIDAVERSLAGERILIVETSSLDDFDATRHFYASRGYTQEAVIRDYWAKGDDKVIFWKRLGP